jgi:membrane protein involved in colicin uptake
MAANGGRPFSICPKRRYQATVKVNIGGNLGLGAGALIGDQLQRQQNTNQQQQQQILANQAEMERQRLEMQRIKRQREY